MVDLFYSIKHLFPQEVLHKLYYSLVYPHLNYCVLAWGSAKQSHINPLIVLQKRICRIITESNYYAHSGPLFKQLEMLKVNDLYLLHCQMYMYKTLMLNAYPKTKDRIASLQTHHQYQTRNIALRNVYCRISVCQQSLLYNIIKAWNVLPDNVKNVKSITTFKKTCKKLIITNY